MSCYKKKVLSSLKKCYFIADRNFNIDNIQLTFALSHLSNYIASILDDGDCFLKEVNNTLQYFIIFSKPKQVNMETLQTSTKQLVIQAKLRKETLIERLIKQNYLNSDRKEQDCSDNCGGCNG